jgi:dTDP-glucose 4,6-dehydratase
VEGLYRLLRSAEVEPVNIGNPAEFTIRQLVAAVERVVGRPVAVAYEPLPVDDPRVRQPDITRARTILDWEPLVDLETGLRATAAYFRAQGIGG